MRGPSLVEMKGDDNSATLPVLVQIRMSLKQCMSSTEYIGYVLQAFIHILVPLALRNLVKGSYEGGEPLLATPCCNTSHATWSTPSEASHRKPFFEVFSFSALFGSGCCWQLVCFEFGVLHFRLPLYTRNGQVGEHVLLLWFLALVLAGCCCQLVCFEFVVLHFRLPIPETGRL